MKKIRDVVIVGMGALGLLYGKQILRSLNPDGYPSMRQDALAGRLTEVGLFAGTVVDIARKHGIAVPVNEKFLNIIREREKGLKS